MNQESRWRRGQVRDKWGKDDWSENAVILYGFVYDVFGTSRKRTKLARG